MRTAVPSFVCDLNFELAKEECSRDFIFQVFALVSNVVSAAYSRRIYKHLKEANSFCHLCKYV
jgi:hypothetical protein